MKDARKAPPTFGGIIAELKKAGWGKDKLTQDIEESFCNIGVSFIDLKPHFELLQKAYEIFDRAFTLIYSDTPDGLVAHLLFGRTSSCFLGAAMLSCSGQLTETYTLLRAIIENTLYAFYIFGNPKRATIWEERHKDEDCTKKCRETFNIRSIWDELKKRSRSLEKDTRRFYNMAIDYGAHPNERSVFTNIRSRQDGSGYLLFIHNTDAAFIRATICATIHASLLTFRILAFMFPEVFNQSNLNVKVKNLSKQLKPLLANLTEHEKQRVRGHGVTS